MKKRQVGKAQKAPATLHEKSGRKLAGLRELTSEEMEHAWQVANAAGQVHQPVWLRTLWERRMQDGQPQGVAELVAILRRGMETPEMDDPAESRQYLARLLHIAVERFERLVAGGVMNGCLSTINALP